MSSLRDFQAAKVLEERKRAQTDLYWLCSEVLGYKWNKKLKLGMTEQFHRPLCERMDRLANHERVATLTERGALKTTIFTIGDILQEFLIDPDVAILVVHAVEDEVLKIVDECAQHVRGNERYRNLLGAAAPNPRSKSWYKTDQFTLTRTNYSRQPSLLGRSVNSEVTGAHVHRIYLDDIVARRTIENSELPKVKSWLRNTMQPVLLPGGKIRVVGTRWAEDDPYQDMIDSNDWDVVARSALETDGELDYKGTPVYYGPDPGDLELKRKRLNLMKREMGPDFAAQMMNDPSPASERPWESSKCEHFVDLKFCNRPGSVFVLSDPAPAKVGSFAGDKDKSRQDGSKDFWATCVVRVQSNGSRQEVVLLDGTFSREWTVDEGFDEMCRLAKKWNTALMGYEATGQAVALYENSLRQSARRIGCQYHPVKLKNTYKGKNQYFAALVSRAMQDEFFMCSTLPDEFREEFLAQARSFRPLPTGRNSLKYDDVVNCVSFCTDPSLQEYSPQGEQRDPFADLDAEEEMSSGYRTRYCRV